MARFDIDQDAVFGEGETAIGVVCACCRRPTIPHPEINSYAFNGGGVLCDDCVATNDPDQFKLMRLVRDVSGGDVVIKAVDVSDIVDRDDDEDNSDRQIGICPRCQLNFLAELQLVGGGWLPCDSITELPLCRSCAAMLPHAIRDAIRELRGWG